MECDSSDQNHDLNEQAGLFIVLFGWKMRTSCPRVPARRRSYARTIALAPRTSTDCKNPELEALSTGGRGSRARACKVARVAGWVF